LAPKDATVADDNAPTPLSRFQDFEERISGEFSLESNKPSIEDIRSKFGEDTREMLPYQTVFLQECETLGLLIEAVCKSCYEIVLANKGELTMSEQMENLMNDIFLNRVPPSWMKLSFESTRNLASWLESLNARLQQLNSWKDDVSKLPRVTWLNRLKNPSSFLTAVQQVYARKHQYELNKLYVKTDIMKKMYWDDLPEIREIDKGAYIFGMQVEAAKWDMNAGNLDESDPKK
jgi:dynein heavy chain